MSARPQPASRSWLARYPENINWHGTFEARPFQVLLDEAVARYADRPCVEFLDRQMTYREVDHMVVRIARGLQDLGVRKGTKVGLFLPNCPYSVVCFFAILKAGGTIVNYNPLYVTREIEQQVEDSETEIMITLDLKALLPKLEPLVGKGPLKAIVVAKLVSCLPFPKSLFYPWVKRGDIAAVPSEPAFVPFERLLASDGNLEPVSVDPEEDIALIQYTGGTTGVPKGAVHTHASLVINAEQLDAWAPQFVPGEERILGVIPLFHVLAISTVLTYGIRTGALLILLPRFDLDQVLQTIHKKRPTFLPGVPTMYNAISAHPRIERFDLTSIKFCISGGAPLPIEIKETFERRAGCSLVEGYGLTEAPVTHIVDRLKDLIICSGFNVHPRVVEEALYEHPDIVEAAVCGVPDDYRGETVKAYVVRKTGADLDEASLLAFLKDKISPIEMPKIVAFRDALPKSAVGKILKKELLREEREQAVPA